MCYPSKYLDTDLLFPMTVYKHASLLDSPIYYM